MRYVGEYVIPIAALVVASVVWYWLDVAIAFDQTTHRANAWKKMNQDRSYGRFASGAFRFAFSSALILLIAEPATAATALIRFTPGSSSKPN